jgi:hypothetical protein
MTLTVNLHNCAGWAASTAYIVGDRRSNSSSPVKAYQCITAGTSAGSGGPTGTGASITDGGAIWKYLSAVDYTTLTAAIAGLGTLTQPTVIAFWNDAEWAMYKVILSGNSPTATNTLTLQPTAGEGFKDNANAQTNALRYNQANGVAIANSDSGYDQAIVVNQSYVTIKGLQIRGGGVKSDTLYVNSYVNNLVIDSCILDNGSVSNRGAALVSNTDNVVSLTNCVLICNTATACFYDPFGKASLVNCTLVRVGATAPTGVAYSRNYNASSVMKNCAFFGFASIIATTSTFTTCATDIASPPSGVTGSLSYASQFQNTGATPANRDFRLKAGSGLIDAGTTATTEIPAALDIVGTVRPQGSAWDIGAWELIVVVTSGKPSTFSIIFY